MHRILVRRWPEEPQRWSKQEESIKEGVGEAVREVGQGRGVPSRDRATSNVSKRSSRGRLKDPLGSGTRQLQILRKQFPLTRGAEITLHRLRNE